MNITPVVFESGMHGEQAYDVFSWLMKQKTIYLCTEMSTSVCNTITAQLLFAEKQGWDSIDMFINSPGGCVSGLLSIIDVMENIKTKVNTICIGTAASAAAVLLTCGHKRYASKRSKIMFHDISSGVWGTYNDIKIQYEELEKTKDTVAELISERIITSKETVINTLLDRDRYLTPKEAIDLRVIDSVYNKVS